MSPAAELVAIGRELHARNWVPATSGNFSSRLDASTLLITASGTHKGRLGEDDFLTVDSNGRPTGTSTARPSAETVLHAQIYRRYPWASTVLHCHSPNATVLSMRHRASSLAITGYELLKAFRGITTHTATLLVPIVANSQDLGALAAEVEGVLVDASLAYLIRGHGVYVWGASADECQRHLEALDFLMYCELQRL